MPGGDIDDWPGCGALAGVPALPDMGPVAALRSVEHATGRMGRIRARVTTRRIMARRPSGGCRTPRKDRQRRSHACRAARPASTVKSHTLAMPRPSPAPRPALFRLAPHAAHGASRHGRARPEARPAPGQSGFAPCRRQPPVDIHSWHFRLDAGREAKAAPARRVDREPSGSLRAYRLVQRRREEGQRRNERQD
jgi:hypothetical protein